eukprot:Selendium_serpulae@DN2781_c1_g1_i1.p2
MRGRQHRNSLCFVFVLLLSLDQKTTAKPTANSTAEENVRAAHWIGSPQKDPSSHYHANPFNPHLRGHQPSPHGTHEPHNVWGYIPEDPHSVVGHYPDEPHIP